MEKDTPSSAGAVVYYNAHNVFMPAHSINEVISRLDDLIRESRSAKNRIGYFAALYLKMTSRVKDAIEQNSFEDGKRMETLDVLFANRYLEAVHQFKSGKQPTAPWQTAFEATRKSSPLVLQHLLLGINAHINLDLGIAAVQTIADGNILDIRRDFNNINAIIGSLVFEVVTEINRVSPLLSLFGLHAGNNSILIQFSITNARDGAWGFAEELATKKDTEFDTCIAERSASINKLADSLLHPSGILRFTRWFIHLFEWRNPAKIIEALYTAKKEYIHTKKQTRETA